MRKIMPDTEKAKSLLKMAEKIEERVQETNFKKYPSQVLRDYYDIIRQLMEALSSLDGVKSEGRWAHKKLIDWVADKYNFWEKERIFLHQMRLYRNRISYEGFSIKTGYLKRNEEKIEQIIKKLKKTAKENLHI